MLLLRRLRNGLLFRLESSPASHLPLPAAAAAAAAADDDVEAASSHSMDGKTRGDTAIACTGTFTAIRPWPERQVYDDGD